MGYTEFISCDTCGNFILPGEVAAITFKGVVNDDNEVEEVEGTITVHFCEGCALIAASSLTDLRDNLQERMELEEEVTVSFDDSAVDVYPVDEEEEDFEPNYEYGLPAGSYPSLTGAKCSQTCCPACAQPDRCCAGFPKDDAPEEAANYLGFGVTEEEYDAACRSLGLFVHGSGPGTCQQDINRCSYSDRIMAAIRMGR